jgi:hypothetical protein
MTLILGGCVVQKPIQINSPFDAEQARKQLEKGNSSITGEAFVKKIDGGIVTCAGSEVVLIPATDYAKERLSYKYGSSGKQYRTIMDLMTNPQTFIPDPIEYSQYEKIAQCNSLGHFQFNNIKNGEYFIIATVAWGPLPNNYYPEGSNILRKIIVKDTNEHIIMTN